MICTICQHDRRALFKQRLLNRYDVQYLYCDHCGLLQTEKPYWLNEAYSEAIAGADTGLVQRNLVIARQLSILLYFMFDSSGGYADFAGGTGLLVRLMRDIGFDFYWHDPYSTNVHARGFEFEASERKCHAITAFEVLEHLENPVSFIEESMKMANTGCFIFTTELFDGRPPDPGKWWYYAPETGQHIAFYQFRTLAILAERLGLNFVSASGFHLFSTRPVSPIAFRLAVMRAARLLYPWIRWRMTSKTMEDHYRMLKRSC